MAYQLADVLQTALKCATVAFGGYMAFMLLQARIINPPPRVLTLESADLQEIHSNIDAIRTDVTSLESNHKRVDELTRRSVAQTEVRGSKIDRAISVLQERSQSLEEQVDTLTTAPGQLPPGTMIEYGTVFFQRPEDYEKNNCRRIKFKNKYQSPPLIFTNQWNTAGFCVAAQAQEVTKTGALICVSIAKQNRNYRCRIAYVVIGQITR